MMALLLFPYNEKKHPPKDSSKNPVKANDYKS